MRPDIVFLWAVECRAKHRRSQEPSPWYKGHGDPHKPEELDSAVLSAEGQRSTLHAVLEVAGGEPFAHRAPLLRPFLGQHGIHRDIADDAFQDQFTAHHALEHEP